MFIDVTTELQHSVRGKRARSWGRLFVSICDFRQIFHVDSECLVSIGVRAAGGRKISFVCVVKATLFDDENSCSPSALPSVLCARSVPLLCTLYAQCVPEGPMRQKSSTLVGHSVSKSEQQQPAAAAAATVITK